MEDLESLKTWKAKELTAECQRQGRFRFVGFFFERKGGGMFSEFSVYSFVFLFWLNQKWDVVDVFVCFLKNRLDL